MSPNKLKLDNFTFFSDWSHNWAKRGFEIKLFIILLFSFLLMAGGVNAQSTDNYNVNSPYSRIGIGNIAPEGSIRNIGMGGTGVSQSNGTFLNMINPALLINNKVHKFDSLYSILEGGMISQLRRISDQNASQLKGYANFFSFHYAFPVHKRWVTAVGLRPYSNVSYSVVVNAPVQGTNENAEVTYQGKGGINRAEIANAYRISKNVHLGLSASYLFGSVDKYSFSVLKNQPDSNIVGSNQNLVYKGFLFKPGISYRTNLTNRGEDSSLYLNIGLAYDWFVGMHAKENFYIERRNYVNQVVSKLSADAVNHSVQFPNVLRTGVSLDNGSGWNIALDFSYYQGSSYRGVNNRDSLKNGFTIALGGELVVGEGKNEGGFENTLRLKHLRAGLSYTKSPIAVNGKQLNEMSVSFGCSLPVGRMSSFRITRVTRPQLNLAIVAGQIGTTNNNLVKEQYIKGFIGFTINDKWFKKRRID